MSDIRELLERLKSATGPDRELDALIAVALLPWDGEAWAESDGNITVYLEPSGKRIERSASVTASIDAALALVERECGDDGDLIGFMQDALDDMPRHGPFAGKFARALIAAFLTAKLETEDHADG